MEKEIKGEKGKKETEKESKYIKESNILHKTQGRLKGGIGGASMLLCFLFFACLPCLCFSRI